MMRAIPISSFVIAYTLFAIVAQRYFHATPVVIATT